MPSATHRDASTLTSPFVLARIPRASRAVRRRPVGRLRTASRRSHANPRASVEAASGPTQAGLYVLLNFQSSSLLIFCFLLRAVRFPLQFVGVHVEAHGWRERQEHIARLSTLETWISRADEHHAVGDDRPARRGRATARGHAVDGGEFLARYRTPRATDRCATRWRESCRRARPTAARQESA